MNARPQDPADPRGRQHLAELRRESLRTNLWLIPTALVVAAVVLFLITYAVDRAADNGSITLPNWVNSGSADAARTILTTIAASVLTVVGVVFSITILALTLASTQFGPRMLRNFISDRGTQFTLGTFVGTFVFSVLALGSVAQDPGGPFVPHLSVTVALLLLLADLGVLIYFIHHIATTIQLTEVVHRIAHDLDRAIDDLYMGDAPDGAEAAALARRAATHSRPTPVRFPPCAADTSRPSGTTSSSAPRPRTRQLSGSNTAPATSSFAAVHWRSSRPGRQRRAIAQALERGHVVGPHRTLQQDVQFAIDQLVEIALRALSPAVNDTFTALTCIDWLGDGLCKITSVGLPDGIHRDSAGNVRVIEAALSYDGVVNRAFDKIRQAGRGMPAVNIRQLDSLAKIAEYTGTDEQRSVFERQAASILRSAEESVPEPNDRSDIGAAYDGLRRALATMVDSTPRAREFLAPSPPVP